MPLGRAGELDGDHRFTKFGAERFAVLARRLHSSDQRFEDHADGALRGKGHGGDGFAVAGRSETVPGPEVDEGLLFLHGQLPGVADGELAGLVEGRREHLPTVDKDARGAPGTQ